MKKIYFISTMVLMVMALCSCTNTDYQKAIPANATLVVKADMKSIAKKADLQKSEAMKLLESSLKAVVKGKDMSHVNEIIEDPEKMGIDFSMPFFFFMIGNETFGLTMKVDDAETLKEFILFMQKQGLASKPVEKDDLMCGTLLDDIHYSYDDNALLVLASPKGKGSATTSRLARELMSMKGKDCFVNTKEFDHMDDEDNDVVCYTKVGGLPEDCLSGLMLMLPSSLKKDDLGIISCVDFEDGKAVITSQVWGKTGEAQDAIEDADKSFDEIDGTFIDRASANLQVWIGANMKGEWLLGKLKENENGKEMLFLMERAIDIEQMLKAVKGDVALEFQMPANGNSKRSEYVAYAELDNDDFLGDVDYWKKSLKSYGMSMRDNGENQYVLTVDRDSYAWGVQDEVLYIATEKATRKASNDDDNPLDNYRKEIKDSKFFVYADLTKFSLEQEAKREKNAWLLRAVKALKAAVVKSDAADKITLTIELQDEDENFLKQIL